MELAFQLWPTGAKISPDTKKLIFLHGMGGTGALWRPIAAVLEERFQILAPDQRGHGQSRMVGVPGGRSQPEFTPLEFGRDLLETMEKQDFHPAWLIGHSMGVRTACAAAHLKPEWVQGLVLVDLGFSGVAGGGLGENLAHFIRILPETFSSREEAKEFMRANCPDPAIGQYLMAVSKQFPDGRYGFPFDHAALIKTIESARDSSVRTWVLDLARQKKPILVLRGQNSLVWTHDEFEKERQTFKSLPSISFEEIPSAGHGLPFEKRPLFIQTVEEFIKKHSH